MLPHYRECPSPGLAGRSIKQVGELTPSKITTFSRQAFNPAVSKTDALQQTLKELERAYGNFFAGRAAFPRFRKKGKTESFRYPDPEQFRIDVGNSRILLPNIGWVRYRNSRDVLGPVYFRTNPK